MSLGANFHFSFLDTGWAKMGPKVLATLLLVIAVSTFIFLSRGSIAGTQVKSLGEYTHVDIDRNAVRQVKFQVTRFGEPPLAGDSDEPAEAVHSLTIFGPAQQILEPWTEIKVQFDGLTLNQLNGTSWRVPKEARVVYLTAQGNWEWKDQDFPELVDVRLPKGPDSMEATLPQVLRAEFPSQATLIDAAFPKEEGSP